jgi:hypothetical protein
MALSLRWGSFQLRNVSRIAFAALFETAGLMEDLVGEH